MRTASLPAERADRVPSRPEPDAGRRVLAIQYFFPPLGGPGVQRNLKFIKFLPEFGWSPWVLTVKALRYHAHDPTLLEEVPPEAVVVRSESIDPLRLAALVSPPRMNVGGDATPGRSMSGRLRATGARVYRAARDLLAFPDAHIGWIPFLLWNGRRIIAVQDINVIFARTVPFSAAVAARVLSRATGVPYVLDMADGWTDDPHLKAPTRIHRSAHRWLEAKVVGEADGVSAYAPELRDALRARYPRLDGRIELLTNGFDPADLEAVRPRQWPDERRRIVYTGSLYQHQEPNYRSLLEGLRSLNPRDAAAVEVLFVGQVFEGAEQIAEEYGALDRVRFLGYQPHGQALSHLTAADAALLFIQKGDHSMITGKVFEYLMARVPLIASIEPRGACAEILREVGLGDAVVDPESSSATAAALQAVIRGEARGPDPEKLRAYDRRHITARLAGLLTMAAEGRGREAA